MALSLEQTPALNTTPSSYADQPQRLLNGVDTPNLLKTINFALAGTRVPVPCNNEWIGAPAVHSATTVQAASRRMSRISSDGDHPAVLVGADNIRFLWRLLHALAPA